MGALRAIFAAVALSAATPAQAESVARWRPHIEEASARFGVPVEWIERVMRAESGGRTMLNGRPIISHAGAMGLMQIMPTTWAELRARLRLGADPHHPRDNIMAGTFYLRLMYDRFGHPGLFAAYNAGPARYAEHLRTGRRLPGETRAYLATVGSASVTPPRPDPVTRPQGTIFFALRQIPAATEGQQDQPPSLFVALRGAQGQ